jgi:RNA polymerase sigma-70 factor (ECF subfamily)
MSDLATLVGAATGEAATGERRTAERELCELLAPRIRLYGLRHLRDEAAAADLVQDALVVLVEAVRAGRIDQPEHVDRFVLGTCRNLVSRSRRKERRAQAFMEGVLPLSAAELPPAYTRLDATRVSLCLGQLGVREQRVVLLTFQEERSADEIAGELATSPGNVRVLRHRAMAALQRCVEGRAA